MFHRAFGGYEGYTNQVASRLAAVTRILEAIDIRVAKRLKLTKEDYQNKCNNEMWLVNAKEAKDSNVIDDQVTLILKLPKSIPIIAPVEIPDGVTKLKKTNTLDFLRSFK